MKKAYTSRAFDIETKNWQSILIGWRVLRIHVQQRQIMIFAGAFR